MMALSRRALLFGAPFAGFLRRLAAQQNPTTFSTDVKVVNLFATVRDKQGKIVRDLAKSDFLLEDDGRPQTIQYFTHESDLPLTLGLLIDTSGSQRRLLDAERTASYNFLEQVLREDKDLAFIIHFDREVELLQDLTSSRKKLEASLKDLRVNEGGGRQGGGNYPQGGGGGRYPGGGGPVPRQGGRGGGGTALFDAVLLASDELMKKQSGRKALILLSDGVDTGSKVTITRAIEAAQRAETMVYSIRYYDTEGYNRGMGGYGGPPMGRRRGGYPPRRTPPSANLPDGKKILERLARETGGGYFEVTKKQPVEKVYSRIQEELRHQYSIGYSPEPKAAAGFHKIKLTAKTKGLIVQTRDGYYAGA